MGSGSVVRNSKEDEGSRRQFGMMIPVAVHVSEMLRFECVVGRVLSSVNNDLLK